MPRRVLITGGAGFIGSHTADLLLQAGHQVRVLDALDPQVHGTDRTIPDYLNRDIEFIAGDVRDVDLVVRALHKVDAVYHFAAVTGTAQSMYERSRYVDVNVTGTAALWDAIENGRRDVERVILASSRAVYGEGACECTGCGPVAPKRRGQAQLQQQDWAVHCPNCSRPVSSVPTPETHPSQPESIYAATKAFQEELCQQTAASTGTKTVILRYFNVYGPRQSLSNAYTGIASVFLSRLLTRKPIHLFEDGLPERDFVSVFDVARANALALDAEIPDNRPINVGSGRGTTIRRLAEIVCSALRVAPAIQVTGWSRLGDIRSAVADCSRARSVLGFNAQVSIEHGISDLLPYVANGQPAQEAYEMMIREIRNNGILVGHSGSGLAES